MSIKRMGAGEFRELGYLQEVNRRFLHPLGLALEVVIEEDGTVCFGEVWDYRDDPEGISFADVDLSSHARRIESEIENRRAARTHALGSWIQPAESNTENKP